MNQVYESASTPSAPNDHQTMNDGQFTVKYPLPFLDRVYIVLSVVLGPMLYIVLILIALFTLAAAAGLVAGAFYLVRERMAMVRVAIFLVTSAFVLLVGAFGTLRAIFTVFRAPTHFDPAVWINDTREPQLMTFIYELCHRMGATPPDAVTLNVLPTFFVMQGRVNVLNANPSGRILSLGLPLLGCLSVNELRAILAHEFAHFTGHDTLFTSLGCRVYRSLLDAGAALYATKVRQKGFVYLITALPLTAPLTGLRCYYYLFSLLNLRVSRGRELRADAIASQVCGTRSFRSGLRKVVAYSGVYGDKMMAIAEEIAHSHSPSDNLLRTFRKRLKSYGQEARDALEKEDLVPEEKWNSHPTLRTRLAAVPEVMEQYSDDKPALTLLNHLHGYEKVAGSFLANEFQMMRRAAQERRF